MCGVFVNCVVIRADEKWFHLIDDLIDLTFGSIGRRYGKRTTEFVEIKPMIMFRRFVQARESEWMSHVSKNYDRRVHPGSFDLIDRFNGPVFARMNFDCTMIKCEADHIRQNILTVSSIVKIQMDRSDAHLKYS